MNQPDLWTSLPHSHELAKMVSPDDGHFEYLHAAQLLKHILALKQAHGLEGFQLLYLWYDAYGEPGRKHRNEVEEFATIVGRDGIGFQAITYQKVILNLARKFREAHQACVDYLFERYL